MLFVSFLLLGRGWLSCFAVAATSSKDATGLLMIGNSFTAANDLEGIVQNMLNEDVDLGGHVYAMEFRKPGSVTLLLSRLHGSRTNKMYRILPPHIILSALCSSRFSEDARNDKIRSTIIERPWTWVVIQEQSQLPTFYDLHSDEYKASIEAASTINDWISSANSETILLMTWGQRHGDSMNPNISPDFPVMQERLKTGYGKLQERLSTPERPVIVAPAGMAFQAIYDASGTDPTVDGTDFTGLFQGDGKHPSMEGSYLTACVIYYSLTGKHPSHLKYKPHQMSIERAQFLQTMASTATDRYNEMNTFNQQYYEAVKKRNQGSNNNNNNIIENHDSQKDKKPYVAPEGRAKSPGLDSTWILAPLLVAILVVATWKQHYKSSMESPRRIKNPSMYHQIQTHDDMELVEVSGQTNA